MYDEEIHNITLYETPETDEAEEILHYRLKKINIIIIPLIAIAIVLFFPAVYIQNPIFVTFYIIYVIITLLVIGYTHNKISPYRALVSIAKKNDQIRHEERVRYYERKRLEEQDGCRYITPETIEMTIENYTPKKPKIKKGEY